MALPNNNTMKSLVDAAEKKAAELSNIDSFDFVEYLENGGVVMPTDQVTLFTDAKTSQRIIELQKLHSDVLLNALKEAQGKLEAQRDARFNELLEQADQTDWVDGVPDKFEDDDDIASVGGDGNVYREVELRKLWEQVFAEFPTTETKEVKEAAVYLDEMEALSKKIYEGRIIVDLEGQQPGDNREMEESIISELELRDQSQLTAEQRVEYASQRRAAEMTAACITRVQIPSKGIDNDLSKNRMPAAAARRFLNSLHASEVTKLMDAVQMLTTAAIIVEPSVDAGFPGGPVEQAGERAPESGDQDGGDV